jgi:hypothetical protein
LLFGCEEAAECSEGETECQGAIARRCGPAGENSDSYKWYELRCRSADLCVVPPSGDAFCVVEPAPNAACTDRVDERVCIGETVVRCRYGWVTARRTCLSCSTSGYPCPGGLGYGCALSSECAPGLSCVGGVPNTDPLITGATCSVPCDCPPETSCPACDAFSIFGTADFSDECVDGICVASANDEL